MPLMWAAYTSDPKTQDEQLEYNVLLQNLQLISSVPVNLQTVAQSEKLHAHSGEHASVPTFSTCAFTFKMISVSSRNGTMS